MSTLTPPTGLTPSGLKRWKTLKSDHLFYMSHTDFTSFDDYLLFRKDQVLSPFKSILLEGVSDPSSIDSNFLRNLCIILSDMKSEIDYCAQRNHEHD